MSSHQLRPRSERVTDVIAMRSARCPWGMVGLQLLLLAFGGCMPGARDAGHEAVGPDDLPRLVMGELLPTGARITPRAARGAVFQELRADSLVVPHHAVDHAVTS